MAIDNELHEEIQRIIVTLKREGDRGCVLVAAALLEDAIEAEILARLIEHQEKTDQLVSRSGNSPINTFSAKIELAFRIGLCTDSERKLYHQLRNLRNDCAHRTDEQDFSKVSFKHRIENIISQSTIVWESMRQKFGPLIGDGKPTNSVKEFVEKIGWRHAFTLFFSFLIAHKRHQTQRIPRIPSVYKKA